MARLVVYSILCFLLAPLSLCSPTSGNHASHIHLTPRAQTPLDFSSSPASQWIWADTTNTVDPVGFRYQWLFSGKFLADAEIITTAFDTTEFYVNGALMTADNVRPRYASRACASFAINPVSNVFAILAGFNNATSAKTPAAIAKILLTFTDGSQQTIVTDSSWLAMPNPPATFAQTTFVPSGWTAAKTLGVVPNPPWDEVNSPNDTDSRISTFDRGGWIWTDAIPASGDIPAGQRAFRRTFAPALGQIPDTARIIIVADHSYQLWVNGVFIGSKQGFRTADTWDIVFTTQPVPEIVFAVLVDNNAGTAGLMMGSEINFKPVGPTNCVAGSFVNTEADADTPTWKSTKDTTIPANWQQIGFDDSNWAFVVKEGDYPEAQPWGADITIAAPTTTAISI
ncbi:hypothetical protein GGX14DRAFT_700664 [Mycena pura]|uniref:Uncharacterized protein n=1 Tax=Mycena pura TaxID=153505 RepID=A0AAD6UZN4_9AGAR|nr:hypothetical protein GGX14DRAFT_700664 [Mycena pura]